MGLERDSRNKVLFVSGITLLDAVHSEAQYPWVYQQVSAMSKRINAYAKSIGSSEEFIYLNYAHANQDPIRSYGSANAKFIKRVADKYDPDGFFQLRVPGGFKVDSDF